MRTSLVETLARTLRTARALVGRDRPIYVHYAVTSRCNLRCAACAIWRRGTAEGELPLAEVRELAGILARLGCLQVSLGGGEPILRDDLPQIVAAFRDAGIRPRVLTNGAAMTREAAQRLLDAGLRDISFSLNSLRAERQERLDNAPGSAARQFANLLAVAELWPRRGAVPILNTVVTPQNLDELPDLLALAERLGFYSSFIPVHHAADDEHRFYGDAPELRFGPADRARLDAAYRTLIAAKRAGRPIVNSTAFLDRSAAYLVDGRVEWPCRAGALYLSVAPDGMVSACHAFEGVDAVPFREIARLRPHGSCEGCFRPCWAEVSFLALDPRSRWEMVCLQWNARFRGRRVDRTGAAASLGLAVEAAS
jgi:MoaA/NifB/PqqE/SkfB family radical SAM enzyme